MENLKVALREYDLNRSFAQLWADKPADAYIVKEIRFSKMLWQHLLDGKDATFQIHADLYSDPENVHNGLVGKAYGIDLTTEWTIEHASKMTCLPGYVTLYLYEPKDIQPIIPPQPVNLLNLAQQVTSP